MNIGTLRSIHKQLQGLENEARRAIEATTVDDAVLKCALAECEGQERMNFEAQRTNARLGITDEPPGYYCASCGKRWLTHAAALFIHLMQCPKYRAEIEPKGSVIAGMRGAVEHEFRRPMGVAPWFNDKPPAKRAAGDQPCGHTVRYVGSAADHDPATDKNTGILTLTCVLPYMHGGDHYDPNGRRWNDQGTRIHDAMLGPACGHVTHFPMSDPGNWMGYEMHCCTRTYPHEGDWHSDGTALWDDKGERIRLPLCGSLSGDTAGLCCIRQKGHNGLHRNGGRQWKVGDREVPLPKKKE